MKKKLKNKFNLESILILVCITMIIISCSKFYVAYHNIDLIVNVQSMVNSINGLNLNQSLNETFFIPFEQITDTGGDYVTRPLKSYYIPSMNNLDNWFIIGLFNMLILGLLLGRKL